MRQLQVGDKVLCVKDHRLSEGLIHREFQVFTVVHEKLVNFFLENKTYYRKIVRGGDFSPEQKARHMRKLDEENSMALATTYRDSSPGGSPQEVYWSMVVTFLQRQGEDPPLL